MRSAVILLFLAIGAASAGPMGRVLRLTPSSKAQLDFIASLDSNTDFELDFWTHPAEVGVPVDIRVTHDDYAKLAKLLASKSIVFTIQIPDLDALSSKQNPPASRSSGFDYQKYNTFQAIYTEMDNLVRQHSQLATMQNLGNTYEGRPMKAVKISSGRGKKTFFMNCGIHAREWITQATCMYMLNQILYKYGKDQTVTAMLDKMDFVIMPILNVDGYVYTHTHNRMWRKTRKPYGGCYGADPNRNWSFKWGGVGTSSDPCRDTYRGPRPFSEVEALNVARYLYRNRKSLIGYMDIHAYSQLWMTSWGFNRAYPPAYNTKVKPAGQKAVEALRRVYGTHYRLGPSSIIIYATSGGTMDWATGVLGIEYSYGLELRDKGKYGFVLPANQILPTGVETFAAIKAMVQEMKV